MSDPTKGVTPHSKQNTPSSSRINLRQNLSSYFLRSEPGASEDSRLIPDSAGVSYVDSEEVNESDTEAGRAGDGGLLPGGESGRELKPVLPFCHMLICQGLGRKRRSIDVARKVKQRSNYYVPVSTLCVVLRCTERLQVTDWLPKYSLSL